MVPKNLSFTLPDRAVLLLAPPLVGLARVFRFAIVALNSTANGILRLFGVEPKNEAASAFTLDEVSTIVSQSKREGVLSDRTGALTAAFEFTSKRVKDVTLPVGDLVSLSDRATPSDVERAVAKHGFSRYVIVDEEGEPDGYLHLKDVIDIDDAGSDQPVPAKRIRQLVSMYEETELEDALGSMRRGGSHLVRTFDESGATTGVLFLEDIIEELVGEVQDATRRM
jgi:CBS domain containing-hemolysin-like protein